MSERLYIHNNKPLYLRSLTEEISVYTPVEFTELKSEPLLRLKTGKMSLSLWRTIAFFFKKINDTEKSEAQVRLFYNKTTRMWKAHAFPQEMNTGMTTKELPDHERFQTDMNEMLAGGFHQWGTAHSHCNATAFQSGTDKTDEDNSAGIHITMGTVSGPKIDLHARFTVILPGSLEFDGEGKETAVKARVYQSKPDLRDFVEVPNCFVSENAPPEIRTFAFDFLINTPSEELVDQELVKRWVENRIPKALTPRVIVPYAQRHPYMGLPHHGTGAHHQGSDYWNRGGKSNSSKKKRERAGRSTAASSALMPVNQSLIEPQVNKVAARHKITQLNLKNILSKADGNLTSSELNVIIDMQTNIFSVYNISEACMILNLEEWIKGRRIASGIENGASMEDIMMGYAGE